MTQPKIVAIGYLHLDWLLRVDHFPINAAEHQPLGDIALEPGGMCNFLISGQRFRAQTTALDVIGADKEGNSLVEQLAAEGVDVSQVIRIQKARSRTVAVLSDSAGRHTFLPFLGDQFPEKSLSGAWLDKVDAADALYLDGFSLRGAAVRGAVLDAAKRVHKQGNKVFMDPGPAASEIPLDLLKSVNGVFITAEELHTWFTAREEASEVQQLQDLGVDLVVVKKGAAGCTVYDNGRQFDRPGFPVNVRDAMGAGDVFNAAFITQFLQGQLIERCAEFANAAGAAAVQKFGAGRNVPTWEEVEAILAK